MINEIKTMNQNIKNNLIGETNMNKKNSRLLSGTRPKTSIGHQSTLDTFNTV